MIPGVSRAGLVFFRGTLGNRRRVGRVGHSARSERMRVTSGKSLYVITDSLLYTEGSEAKRNVHKVEIRPSLGTAPRSYDGDIFEVHPLNSNPFGFPPPATGKTCNDNIGHRSASDLRPRMVLPTATCYGSSMLAEPHHYPKKGTIVADVNEVATLLVPKLQGRVNGGPH